MDRFIAVLKAFIGLSFLLMTCASSCGLTTHIEIAERGIFGSNSTLIEVARTYRGALHAGSVFPDMFFFPCGGPADTSEDTHWTPFLNFSVGYVRNKYGNPSEWGPEAKQLVAFLMGVASHMVSDVLWHNLGIDQGFIRAMANVNFHTNYAPAHTVADALDDSLLWFEMSLFSQSRYINSWIVPLTDILEMFHQFAPSVTITQAKVVECLSMQYALKVLESLIMSGVFKASRSEASAFEAVSSHFLTSNFYDYHLGGFHSMAEASSRIWTDMDVMLAQGTSSCNMDHNPLFVTCGTSQVPLHRILITNEVRRIRCMQRYRALMDQLAAAGTSLDQLVTATVQNGNLVLEVPLLIQFVIQSGVPLDYNDPTILSVLGTIASNPGLRRLSLRDPDGKQQLIEHLHSRNLVEQMIARSLQTMTQTSIVAKGMGEYAECGAALKANLDAKGGKNDLALGCPGLDKVLLTLKKVNKKTKKAVTSNVELKGKSRFERFGSAMAVIDINKDGVKDIAVSAPHSKNAGTVYIFLGDKKTGLATTPAIEIVGSIEEAFAWNIKPIAGLGLSLASADLDMDGFEDLIITAPYSNQNGPQTGSVFIIFSGTTFASNRVAVDTVAEWSFQGTMPYSWFGRSIRPVKLSGKSTLLLVAAPYTRRCNTTCQTFAADDAQSVGSIYGFAFTPKVRKATTSFVLSGVVEDEKLESADIGQLIPNAKDLFLAVGADTFTHGSCKQCGRVTVYPLNDLLGKGELKTNELTPALTIYGTQITERFGTLVRFISGTKSGQSQELLVTSPMHGTGTLNSRNTGLITILAPNGLTKKNNKLKGNQQKWRKRTLLPPVVGRLVDISDLAENKILFTVPRATIDRFDQGVVFDVSLAKLRTNKKDLKVLSDEQ